MHQKYNSILLKSDLQNLISIFGENVYFKIPEYQRGYAWGINERKDLFEDIERCLSFNQKNQTYTHYMGTIVAQKIGDTFEIVDGQQRLTTLIVLISKLIRNGMRVYDNIDLFCKFIKQELPSGDFRLRLEPNTDIGCFFEYYVVDAQQSLNIENKSHENLRNALNESSQWLTNVKSDNWPKYLNIILYNLGFLVYTPEKSQEICLMFETINNRGKKLSNLEKVKNYILYYASLVNHKGIIKKLPEIWPRILKNLSSIQWVSNKNEDEFFRICWIVFFEPGRDNSYDAYNRFRRRFNDRGIDISSDYTETTGYELFKFIQFLQSASSSLLKLYKSEDFRSFMSTKTITYLELISYQPTHIGILPLIVSILSSNRLDNSQLETILELLEKINFRAYGCETLSTSTSGHNDLFWMAHRFFYKNDNYNKLLKELVKLAVKSDDKKIVRRLTIRKNNEDNWKNQYNWSFLKYFLANYEAYLRTTQTIPFRKLLARETQDNKQEFKKNDFYQREHIWAEKEMFYNESSVEENVQKRRLSNFLLLPAGINKSVKNIKIEDKFYDEYESKYPEKMPLLSMTKEAINLFREIVQKKNSYISSDDDIKNYLSGLNKDEVQEIYTSFFDKREEKLLNFLLERWKISSVSSNEELTINSFKIDEESEIVFWQ